MFKRKKRFSFFKKSNSFSPEKKYKQNKYKQTVKSRGIKGFGKTVGRIFIISFFVLIILFLLYQLYIFVLNVRNDSDIDKVGTVYGFDIPTYPNSEFVFENNLEDETVKQFLSLGNSVYRLPKSTGIQDVYEYYKVELAELGWEYVLSVPITSEEKMYGEYFVKDNKGLRIYSRLNDIWYQTLSVVDARNGLEQQVKKETARKLLLLTTEKTELLPDYPWRLSYPTEYTTKYYASSFKPFQGVRFQKIGSNVISFIEPLGYFGAISLDDYISKFLENYNKKYKTKWVVTNSVVTSFKGNDAIKGFITNGGKSGNLFVVNNTGNNVVYIITSFDENEPFANYILSNLRPASENIEESN